MIDLGWHNKGGETAKTIDRYVANCIEQKHHPTDVDIGPQYRGMDHVVTCEECGYKYYYDSSD